MNRTEQKKDTISQSRARASAEIKSEKTTTKIEPLRGWVDARFVRCGRSNCKCAKGELHGPYYVRRWERGGKRRSKYVKKGELSATFAACLAYKRNKQETRELIREINETGNRMLKALGMVIKSWS
jgi:porphobilinogen deaminase